MVDREIITQGGVYLAKLDPSKHAEIGKIRPVVVLTTQALLDKSVPLVFICPLSTQSYPQYRALHTELVPRDNLKATSYALIEQCRSISIQRLTYPRIAQLARHELKTLIKQLTTLITLE